MTANDKMIVSKDVKQLAINILLEYFEDDVVQKIINKLGSEKFFKEIKKNIEHNSNIEKDLSDRFIKICNDLNDILHTLEEIDDKSHIVREVYNSRYDVECSNEYDFIYRNYTLESNVKYALKRKNMTQVELCKKTGIPRTTFNNIIRNPSKATFMNIVKIAYVLNMSIHDLFYIQKIDKNKCKNME
ncbi:helix-turn-helix domain protein [Clostridium botulinum C str. Eklund]|nr:helix-turn-helix domain protein [Clostridium botulinum C str. Eklund]